MEQVARSYAEACGLIFQEKVGSGAFKETFSVLKGNEQLALKILSVGFSPERTKREIDAMVRCVHPHIGMLREVGSFVHDGHEYTCLIEEFLDGGTLRDRLNQRLLSRSEVLLLGSCLLDVLRYLESLDLVHRDFKPENIMFRQSSDWNPIVVDFGLVRDLQKESVTKTWYLRGPGTPLFAPPEQLNNRKELIDWRADQFSVGVTLAFCLLGFHPYAEEGMSDIDTVERVAAWSRPADRFIQASSQFELPVLNQMVMPYPVQRIRRPGDLIHLWSNQ